MKVRIITMLTMLSLVGSGLSAQEIESYEVSFQVYGLKPGNFEGIYVSGSDGESIPLRFRKKQRSVSYKITLNTESPWLIFTRGASSPEAPSPIITQVQLPIESPEQLLIFSKLNDDSKDTLHVSVLDDSLTRFPFGSARILNFTSAPLIGAINGTRFDINSLESTPAIRINSNTGESRLTVVAEGQSRYHLVYNNDLILRRDERTVLILREPARRGSLRLGGHLLKENPAEPTE